MPSLFSTDATISGDSEGSILSSAGSNGTTWIQTGNYPDWGPNCRICGRDTQNAITKNGMCIDCFSDYLEFTVRKYIKESKTLHPMICRDCYKHTKVCKCKKKQAIDKLKT